MLKRILLAILAILVLFVFASCNKNDDFHIGEGNTSKPEDCDTSSETDSNTDLENSDITTDTNSDSDSSTDDIDTDTSAPDTDIDTDTDNKETDSDANAPDTDTDSDENTAPIPTYTISYDFNGGEVDYGKFPLGYEQSDKALYVGIPKREGYKFAGWQINGTDERSYYFSVPKNGVGNYELKAIWFEAPSYELQDEVGFRYIVKEDNTLSIVDYVGEGKTLAIPEEHDGKIVSEIGPYAFAGFYEKIKNLQNIDFVYINLSQNLKKISEGAFIGCTDVKPVYDDYKKDIKFEQWIAELAIEEHNYHLLDVLNYVRPAIGWYPYKKP